MYYSAIGILAAMVLVIENLDIILNRNRSFSLPAWPSSRTIPVWLRCSGVPTRACTRTRRVSSFI